MKFSNILILTVAVLLLAGCKSVTLDEGNGADEFFENAQTVPFETIEQKWSGNYDIEAQNQVIRDEAVFSNFWEELHSSRQPLPPVPEIDFTQDMVVVTVMGTRRSGGYVSEITDAGSFADRLGIRIKERTPGDGCAVTAALTNPYHIVKMDRMNLEVRFFKEEVITDCTE